MARIGEVVLGQRRKTNYLDVFSIPLPMATWALFSFFVTVTLLFVFNKYYLIME
jgi:hypothetical protein